MKLFSECSQWENSQPSIEKVAPRSASRLGAGPLIHRGAGCRETAEGTSFKALVSLLH